MNEHEMMIASINAIAAILKKRFPNLTVGETITIAGEILLSVMKVEEEADG